MQTHVIHMFNCPDVSTTNTSRHHLQWCVEHEDKKNTFGMFGGLLTNTQDSGVGRRNQFEVGLNLDSSRRILVLSFRAGVFFLGS